MNQGSWQAVGKDSFRNVYLFCFCFKGRMTEALVSFIFVYVSSPHCPQLYFFSEEREQRNSKLQSSQSHLHSGFMRNARFLLPPSWVLGYFQFLFFILLHALASSWVLRCFLFLPVDGFCSLLQRLGLSNKYRNMDMALHMSLV